MTVFVPQWFFGLSIVLEIVFAFAAALVAIYAFRVFYLSGQRESRIFSLAFVMIAVSYFVKAMVNLFIISEASEGLRDISLAGLNKVGEFGIYGHMLLFLAGLVTICYMTFKQRNRRMYLLILALAFVPIFFYNDITFIFNLVSSILCLYIVIYYLMEINTVKNNKVKLIALAFVMLFLSGISYVFTPDFYVGYMISHLLELASYILIVTSLVLTIRKK